MENFLKIYRESLLFVVFAIIICIFAINQVKPKINDFISVRNDINQKKAAIEETNTKLTAAKQQAAKMEKAKIINSMINKTIFQPRSLSLDKEAGYSVLFGDIFEMVKSNKIKTYSIQYEYNPTDDPFVSANKGYDVCLLKMKIIGTFTDFENLLTDLYKYPYFISISSYDIVPYYKDKNLLFIKLGIKVYMKNN